MTIMTVILAKTAEPIMMPFGRTCVSLVNYVLDGSTYGHHLVSTIDWTVRNGLDNAGWN